MASMNALVLHEPGKLSLETVPKPNAAPGSVVVKVLAAPMWDYVPDILSGQRGYPLPYPLIFGTACVARVEEVGPDVKCFTPGQLVFCDYVIRLNDERVVQGYHGGFTPLELAMSKDYWRNGCYAQWAKFPAENVHPISSSVTASPFELAEIASLMPALGAANSISVCPGETVLLLPATGFFSSSVIPVVLALGANVVVGSRSQESLDRLVSHFGGETDGRIKKVVLTGDATKDTENLKAATPGGKGADAYIDYAPPMADGTHVSAGIMALKRYGRCCFAGVVLEDVSLPYAPIMVNCITIRGQFAQGHRDVAQVIRFIESGTLKLWKKVQGPFSLKQYKEALAAAKESRGWDKMVVLAPEHDA
ncbi:putative isopropanol dehydrogenase [Metarhizium anisopliae]